MSKTNWAMHSMPVFFIDREPCCFLPGQANCI